MDLGAFQLTTTAVRDRLLAAQQGLVSRLTALMQQAPRRIAVDAAKRYRELQAALAAAPVDAEAVDAKRQLIEALPSKVAEIAAAAEAAEPWCACLHD